MMNADVLLFFKTEQISYKELKKNNKNKNKINHDVYLFVFVYHCKTYK